LVLVGLVTQTRKEQVRDLLVETHFYANPNAVVTFVATSRSSVCHSSENATRSSHGIALANVSRAGAPHRVYIRRRLHSDTTLRISVRKRSVLSIRARDDSLSRLIDRWSITCRTSSRESTLSRSPSSSRCAQWFPTMTKLSRRCPDLSLSNRHRRVDVTVSRGKPFSFHARINSRLYKFRKSELGRRTATASERSRDRRYNWLAKLIAMSLNERAANSYLAYAVNHRAVHAGCRTTTVCVWLPSCRSALERTGAPF